MRNNYSRALLLLPILFLIFTLGCKRESVLENPIDPILPPTSTPTVVNDLTQVTASVSGIVLDESNAPIASAVVTSGASTTTTNSNGMFIFQNISLSKENGSVTVVKAGYFKGIRSFKTTAGKNHTVRLQLMQKVISGSVNAAAGGTINSNGGATIIFPAAAFVTITGAAYTGTVNVYSRWIDPTAANLSSIIPGDLRGVGTNGSENILETYGMVGAELEDASGNTLKIATGKKATISFPLSPSLQASAPSTIQLWHFDDATARWKENGTATKTGATYSAQVDKFSFWNLDVGSTNFVNLDYTLINATTNSPLVSTSTRIKRANGSYGYGITNNTGLVSGLVPKNEVLVLEVIASSSCGNIFYSQNIGPFTANTSLGNINVTIPVGQTINFTGTLVNCSGTPVTNGYIALAASGGNGGFAATNATGNFAFSILNCAGINIAYNYQGIDYTTSQQGLVLTGNATSGTINLGNLAACGAAASADVYVAGSEDGIAKVWKNGIPTNLSTALDTSTAYSVFVSGSDVYVAGYVGQFARIWKNGIGTNLSTNNNYKSVAKAVYVSGLDVYATGYESIGNNGVTYETPKVWKNGIPSFLTLPNGFNQGAATSVFVQGADVYVTGYVLNIATAANPTGIGNRAVIWKNGVPSVLSTGNVSLAYAWSVFVNGTDVYVAGTMGIANDYIKAVYWKNGVVTNLSTYAGNAFSIFVFNSDVYVSGTAETGSGGIGGSSNSVTKYWKNGVSNTVSQFSGLYGANSIFVNNNEIYMVACEYNNYPFSLNGRLWKNGIVSNFFNATNNIVPFSVFVK
jgi:hypothetical protein